MLCDYVLVMVGNKKTRVQIANDLEAFLGEDESKEFSLWLWELLKSVEGKRPFVEPRPGDLGELAAV